MTAFELVGQRVWSLSDDFLRAHGCQPRFGPQWFAVAVLPAVEGRERVALVDLRDTKDPFAAEEWEKCSAWADDLTTQAPPTWVEQQVAKARNGAL